MKKYVLYIIIVILIAVIAVGGTYIFMEGKLNNQNNESENNNKADSKDNQENFKPNDTGAKSGVELVSTKEEGSNIVQTFNAYMNGKTVPVIIKYEHGKDAYYAGEPDDYEYVKGVMNGAQIYWHPLELKGNSQKTKIMNTAIIEENFTTKHFRIIKGTDNKDYLVVVTYNYDSGYKFDELDAAFATQEDKLYVFNDNLEMINLDNPNACGETSGILAYPRHQGVEVKENPWYSNEFDIDTSINDNGANKMRVKVENNQIYYLVPIYKNDEWNEGTLEERVYSISNNKSSYKVIKTYKIISSAGGRAC